MKSRITILVTFLLFSGLTCAMRGEDIAPALQAKIDAIKTQMQGWAANPAIVKAVKAHNTSLPPDHAAMTQDKWKGLSVLDPFVRAFSKNEAAMALKAVKTEAVAETFISDAEGLKVAFLGKPSNWSHKGKAKHDVPMSGKVYQGGVEVDESTGLQQLQLGVPIMDEGKPIGSLLVGLSLSKL